MRKVLLAFLLLSLALSLYATDIYKSNELGQKLSLAEEVGQEDYYLKEEGSTQTLYLDGTLYLTISTETSSSSTNIIKTITKTYATGQVESYSYENGLLKSYSNGTSSVVYNYIDNKLAFCLLDDTTVFFLRSASDAALVAIKRDNSLDLVGDSYLYENGAFYNIVSNNLVFTGNYETQEDGSFIFVDEDKTYHYSKEGLLLSTTSAIETVTYEYQEGKVSSKTSTEEDGSYSVSTYENGSLRTVTEYDSLGVISTFTDYSTGAMVKTVYKDGRAVATIYYKDDNITIESIKYR